MGREEIREKALERTRKQLAETDRVKLMVKAVKNLDRAASSWTEDVEAFRDWYSLHFPELENEIQDDEQLVKILSREVDRNNLKSFNEMAEESTGMYLGEEDRKMLQDFVNSLEERLDLKQRLEQYVHDIAMEEMPNTSILLGPVLAARMVKLAGGLEDLARKPSSTIQVLGAEKALFRHLKEGGNPPKHGILFQHEYVKRLHPDSRGKMARFIANKTAIAARIDQYGDKEKGEALREECREKFEELKEEE
ncbi:MAG: hypothetical protein ABEJ95_07215 [Candidatus Nanohalobium sp.]